MRSSEQTPLLSCLLEGPLGSGKTALAAATLGLDSGFPFVKVISSDNMVGYSEAAKAQAIAKVFDDAYRVRAPPLFVSSAPVLLHSPPRRTKPEGFVLETRNICRLKRSYMSAACMYFLYKMKASHALLKGACM